VKPSTVRALSLHPALALASLSAALAAGGCGDDRNYQPGFTDQAALDEDAYKAAEAAKANGTPVASKPVAPKPVAPKPVAPAPSPSSDPQTPSASVDAASAIAEATGTAATAQAETARPELFEPDGVTPSAAGRGIVNSVVAELALPAPPPIAEAPGEESYQKHARDRRFDEFRRKVARYAQLKKALLPLGRKLADGTATPAERALHNRLEDAIAVEFKPINRYMWDERWSESDRAAMGWILFVKPD
jgi:hypothetical protein